MKDYPCIYPNINNVGSDMDYVKVLKIVLEDSRSEDIPIAYIIGMLEIINEHFNDIK